MGGEHQERRSKARRSPTASQGSRRGYRLAGATRKTRESSRDLAPIRRLGEMLVRFQGVAFPVFLGAVYLLGLLTARRLNGRG